MQLLKRISIILILLVGFGQQAQSQELTRLLLIFDASNSMNGKWEGSTKIDRAREILEETVNDLKGVANLELALRVYGHQSEVTPTYQDCNDTKLEVPFAANNHDDIIGFIKTCEPKGTTPIARSLEACIDDFPQDNSRKVVILITDGLEACDEFPCEVARKLHEGGISITPFVVGLGIDLKYLKDLDCIGRLYEASTLESFKKVMKSVISDAILATSVQFDLKDINAKPTETNVTLFLYEAGTKNLKYTFMHTLNQKGNPDTITIMDPMMKYDLVVNTLPQVTKSNISITRGKHNHIPVNCPTGYMKLKFQGQTKNKHVPIRVTPFNDNNTLHVQDAAERQRYIVDKYKVEILTIPREYQTVEVKQSGTTDILVRGSGMLKLTYGKSIVGQLFVQKDDGTYEWCYDIHPNVNDGVMYLQPGNYKIVYRPRTAVSTDYTETKSFAIQSGQNTFINL